MSTGPEVIAERLLLDAEASLKRCDLLAATRGFDAAEWRGADADRCAAGRWMAAMLQGDFASAWRESDAIRRRGAPDPHRFWNGEDIRGKRLMVRCLHGFGDAVQFLRYAPGLRARAADVIYEVAPRFVELARCFDGVDHVITWGKSAPDPGPEWDVQMEVMELPYVFRTEAHELPITEGYLRLPERVLAGVAKDMGRSDITRVGLVWNAGEWNPSRCVPFRVLSPLLESAGCEFWNLQGPEKSSERPNPSSRFLREAYGCRDGVLTLAGVISQLDLVITVDTLTAHLAGALGVPAWVMLQYAADWRWMTGTSESPWYPSLRLFRQPRRGDWESVVADLRRALADWLCASQARLLAS
jgi:hypothetical protein